MTKRQLAIPIYLSPLIFIFVLFETSANNAYSPDSDSLGIPLFSYLFIIFPITHCLFSQINAEKLSKPAHLFWNSKRQWASAISLIVTIYPIGLLWAAFLMIGISTKSFGTIFGTTLMLITVILTRTYAIQPKLQNEEGKIIAKKPFRLDHRVMLIAIIWSICSIFCAVAHWKTRLSYEEAALQPPLEGRAHFLIPLIALTALLLRNRYRITSYFITTGASLWIAIHTITNGLDIWNGFTCGLIGMVIILQISERDIRNPLREMETDYEDPQIQ